MKAYVPLDRLQETRRQLKERHDRRAERIKKDVERYGKRILESEEMKKAYEQTHHQWSTVGEHTMRVTNSSVRLCYALRKLHINVNVPSVVVGSLCHDLGILGRYEKYDNNLVCSRQHPRDSVRVARKLIEDLSPETEDIIERHMWPIGQSRMPNSIEGMVVSASDKYNSIKDLVKGSEIRNTGIKSLVLDSKNKLGDVIHGK